MHLTRPAQLRPGGAAVLLVLLVLVAVVGLLGPVREALAPAGAATASGSAASGPRARRTITARIVKADGHLSMVGVVRPRGGPVVISKATRCNRRTAVCDFTRYRVRHLHRGRYSVRVFAPHHGRWYWQARVGRARSDIWVTCKTVAHRGC